MKIKTSCIQINSGGDMQANIEKITALVTQAATQGSTLIATPENTFLMEEPKVERVLYTQAEHPGVAVAAKLAKEHGVWLLIGSVAIKKHDSKKTANRALLFDPQGKAVAHYDKIHLFDVEVGDGQSYRESAKIIPGDKAVVADMRSARLGLSVCYDVRFPHIYRTLAKAGAEILAIPAAFTQVTGEAHWHVLNRARAIENGCFVIAPAQTGTHPGNRKTYGHSLIIDPWGRVLADGGTEEGIITAELDMALVKKTRASIPSLMHDREYQLEE
jgi:deaminated glutathione amidase